jgi:hypothetical protein
MLEFRAFPVLCCIVFRQGVHPLNPVGIGAIIAPILFNGGRFTATLAAPVPFLEGAWF